MMRIFVTRARLLTLSAFNSFWFSIVFAQPALSFQNASVEIPTSSSSTAIAPSIVPDSLSELERNWLRILQSPAPSIGDEEMTCEALVEKLRALGLPVVVDSSARDDQLSSEEPLQLHFPGIALLDRLENSLREHNGTITMDAGHIRLISMDFSEDPRFLMLVTYDLTGVTDLESLIETCRSVADPNEDFRFHLLKINGRFVLTVNAPFKIHLKLRQLFQLIAAHTGPFVDGGAFHGISRSIPVAGSAHRTLISSPVHRLGSTPVALPGRNQKAGINLSKDGSNFSGMGGGMFRIPDWERLR